MSQTKFSHLSQLVLMDVLAALATDHVVRMALLGHDRQRQTCSLKWVTDRMTDVNFNTLVLAHRSPLTREAFSTVVIWNRL